MADYSQKNRPIRITTPLGTDAVLLTGLTGTEGLSQLFEFQLELFRPHAKGAIPFDQLLGQGVTVEYDLPGGAKRHFHGIVNRLSQGHVIHLGQSPEETFISYRAMVVPQFWLLTRKTQSRTFQHKNVPDILKEVLKGIPAKFEIQGNFQPRDYCVQYRESDFAFASRLMEEEGIYYFFKHADGSHEMVLANTPRATPTCRSPKSSFSNRSWAGTGRSSASYVGRRLRNCGPAKSHSVDHCFEMPHKHLEAEKTIAASAQAGKVKHKLNVGDTSSWSIYDYPGGYAGRFDGMIRAAATSRPTCRKSSRTTSGRSESGWRRRRPRRWSFRWR